MRQEKFQEIFQPSNINEFKQIQKFCSRLDELADQHENFEKSSKNGLVYLIFQNFSLM